MLECKLFPLLTYGGYTPLLSIAETVPSIMLFWCIFPHSDICLSNSLASYHLTYSHTHFWFSYLGVCGDLWRYLYRYLHAHTDTHYQPPILWPNYRFSHQILVLVGLLLWE